MSAPAPAPSDALTTTRLHISGLSSTSTLTAADLTRRFSAFGTVSNVDGFDSLNGLGERRGYGYLTFTGKKADLSRCVASLSGATWKGAKVRIGDAKPDFRERIAKENAAQSTDVPKRTRRPGKYSAVESDSMEPITLEALTAPGASQTHPHWKVTPMGRVVRVMKMRPGKGLPPTLLEEHALGEGKSKDKDMRGKKRKKGKQGPDNRARVRRIDPTLWGSTLLKGMFLENVDIEELRAQKAVQPAEEEGSDSDDSEEEVVEVAETVLPPAVPVQASAPASPSPPPPDEHSASPARSPSPAPSIRAETSASLALLSTLFPSSSAWSAPPAELDSDIEIDAADEHVRRNVGNGDGEDVEEVPLQRDDDEDSSSEEEQQDDNDDDDSSSDSSSSSSEDDEDESKAPAPAPTSTSLKDLFAPRPSNPSFSLLGHLDLDLSSDELDPELDFLLSAPAQALLAQEEPPLLPTPVQHIAVSTLPSYDPSYPLFFPHPSTIDSLSSLTPLQASLNASNAHLARPNNANTKQPDVLSTDRKSVV